MTRRIMLLVGVAVALLLGGAARAEVPRLINFQGRLADASGTPLNGSFVIAFRIYDASAGGTACHAANQTVGVNNGLVHVNVGEGAGLNAACDFTRPYWLEVQMSGDAAMTPRIKLTAAAYALTAGALVAPGGSTALKVGNGAGSLPLSNGAVNVGLNADLLDGQHASAFALAGHGHGDVAVCPIVATYGDGTVQCPEYYGALYGGFCPGRAPGSYCYTYNGTPYYAPTGCGCTPNGGAGATWTPLGFLHW